MKRIPVGVLEEVNEKVSAKPLCRYKATAVPTIKFYSSGETNTLRKCSHLHNLATSWLMGYDQHYYPHCRQSHLVRKYRSPKYVCLALVVLNVHAKHRISKYVRQNQQNCTTLLRLSKHASQTLKNPKQAERQK